MRVQEEDMNESKATCLRCGRETDLEWEEHDPEAPMVPCLPDGWAGVDFPGGNDPREGVYCPDHEGEARAESRKAYGL